MDIQIKLLCLIQVIFALITFAVGGRSRKYNFPGSYCGSHKREIDGALLLSSTNPLYANNACVLKFVTEDGALFNHKRFMIIFRTFQITDCSVKLSLYYDSSSYGDADEEYDCHTTTVPSVLYTPGKRLTIRLDKKTTTGYQFHIVITTYKHDSAYCSGFRCTNGSQCIDRDLRCDMVENCIDSSDENCDSVSRGFIVTGFGSIMGISMSGFVCCIMASIIGLICCRRRRNRMQREVTVVHTNKPMNVATPQGPPPYGAYQSVPQYGGGYGAPPPPQSYPMTQMYPNQAPGANYPTLNTNNVAIPQYV